MVRERAGADRASLGVTVGKKSLRDGTWLFIFGFLLLIVLFWAHKYLLFWLARLCCSSW